MPCKNTIKLYQKIAKLRGGKCISNTYTHSKAKLKFECMLGHIWETNAVNISGKNRWCPHCAQNKKLSINEIIQYASSFDGYCLSKSYINSISKLHWKCKWGHEWHSTWVSVKNSKGWCPQCTGKFFSENLVRNIFQLLTGKVFLKEKPKWLIYNKSFLELDGYCQDIGVAFEHNGIQHYKITAFSKSKSILSRIKKRDETKKQLCKKNGVTLIIVPDVFNIIGINNLFEFIKNKLIIKSVPINSISNFDISALMKSIKSRPLDDKMKEISDFVKSKGGACMSNYISYNVKLAFRCSYGHEWNAKWNNVKFGTWCPHCYKIKRS